MRDGVLSGTLLWSDLHFRPERSRPLHITCKVFPVFPINRFIPLRQRPQRDKIFSQDVTPERHVKHAQHRPPEEKAGRNAQVRVFIRRGVVSWTSNGQPSQTGQKSWGKVGESVQGFHSSALQLAGNEGSDSVICSGTRTEEFLPTGSTCNRAGSAREGSFCSPRRLLPVGEI
jgi:hypothetical protein